MNDCKRKMKVSRLIEQTMEIDEPPENDERLLKKPEIKRDEHGRFQMHGTGLIKKAQKKGNDLTTTQYQPGHNKPGPGRPKGSQNKTTKALKDMILGALDKVGGEEYLAKLAIENSSAFASLVAKVLPSTLAADDSGGRVETRLTFRRIIVYPGGREEIQGETPKQIAPPASHMLPRDDVPPSKPNEINELDD